MPYDCLLIRRMSGAMIEVQCDNAYFTTLNFFHCEFLAIVQVLFSVQLFCRECPEECKEAASSLMHAAARFSDLPELRELRTVFTERYGNSIESYVNKEVAALGFNLKKGNILACVFFSSFSF